MNCLKIRFITCAMLDFDIIHPIKYLVVTRVTILTPWLLRRTPRTKKQKKIEKIELTDKNFQKI